MKQTNTVLEQVSSLADGELPDAEFEGVMARLNAGADLRASWQTYHLVGDVLRARAHTPCSDGGAFLSRLQQRLASEPVAPTWGAPAAVAPAVRAAEAANAPVFRWKLVAGVASLAAAAAIGWTWMGAGAVAPAGAQLAQHEAPANSVLAVAGTPTPAGPMRVPTRVRVGSGDAQVMLRDPWLDELLEAHQQVSGTPQMPSGFLRNATFEAQAR